MHASYGIPRTISYGTLKDDLIEQIYLTPSLALNVMCNEQCSSEIKYTLFSTSRTGRICLKAPRIFFAQVLSLHLNLLFSHRYLGANRSWLSSCTYHRTYGAVLSFATCHRLSNCSSDLQRSLLTDRWTIVRSLPHTRIRLIVGANSNKSSSVY